MKKIILGLGVLVFISCSEKKYIPVFDGDTTAIEDTDEKVFISGEKIILNNEIHAGYMSVFDSLILFTSYQYPNHLLHVFNLNTGNFLGEFCRKGQGPFDFIDFYHSEQYIVEDDCIKLWGYDSYQKIYLLNLTQSITTNTTVIDTLITQNWMYMHTRPWSLFFQLNPDSFLIKNQPEYYTENNTNIYFGTYKLYRNNLKNILKEYNLFNRLPLGQEEKQLAELYYSLDRINMKKNKIAMGMQYLAPINILDLESGYLKGFRLTNTPDFDDLPLEKPTFYYTDICVNNDIIICLYAHNDLGVENPFSGNIIHIYDWNGNFIQKIELNYDVNQIAFDPVGNFLYGYTDEEEIIQYDFKTIY